MPRKTKKQAAAPAAPSPVETGLCSHMATKVPSRARVLATFDERHPIWDREGKLAPAYPWETLGMMIVRLRPPPGTPAPWVDAVLDAVRLHALAVRVVPPVLAPAVVMPNAAEPAAPRMRPRDVVEQLVNDAVGVDVNALRALVGGVLDKEGL